MISPNLPEAVTNTIKTHIQKNKKKAVVECIITEKAPSIDNIKAVVDVSRKIISRIF